MTSYVWSLLWQFCSNPPLKQQRHNSTGGAEHCAHLMYGFTNCPLHDTQRACAITCYTSNNNQWLKFISLQLCCNYPWQIM